MVVKSPNSTKKAAICRLFLATYPYRIIFALLSFPFRSRIFVFPVGLVLTRSLIFRYLEETWF